MFKYLLTILFFAELLDIVMVIFHVEQYTLHHLLKLEMFLGTYHMNKGNIKFNPSMSEK